MLCIICLHERPSSIEHVFPDAIGGTFTIERVCAPCNSHLGAHVDSHLANHWLVRARRHDLAIQGKTGSPLSPTFRANVDSIAGLQVELRPDSSPMVRLVNPVVTSHGGKAVYWLEGQEETAQRILDTIGQRRGIGTHLSTAAPDTTIVKPTISGHVPIDTHDYRRSVLKVAYQLAHRWLGEEYLSDPFAKALRELLQPRAYELADFEAAPFGAQITITGPLFPNTESLHVAFLHVLNGSLLMVVSVFGLFRGYIQVASTVPRAGLPEPCALAIDATTGAYQECTQDEIAQFLAMRAHTSASSGG
jgi:hypothetical protein